MKRMYYDTANSFDPTIKSKGIASPSIIPALEATETESNNARLNVLSGPNANGLPGKFKEERIKVSSKVNFSKLSPAEQKLRYINQRNEIERLTKELELYTDKDNQMQEALNHIETLPEQKLLLESLCRGIIKGKLKPNTLAYNQISTILRDSLEMPSSETGCYINLPDKKLQISPLEYNLYSAIPCTDSILLNIIGREKEGLSNPLELFQLFSGPTILTKTEETSHENKH